MVAMGKGLVAMKNQWLLKKSVVTIESQCFLSDWLLREPLVLIKSN
jgi:hypothetical protein